MLLGPGNLTHLIMFEVKLNPYYDILIYFEHILDLYINLFPTLR